MVQVPPNRSPADLATSIAAAAATLGDRQRPAARTITLKMEAFVEPQLLHPPLGSRSVRHLTPRRWGACSVKGQSVAGVPRARMWQSQRCSWASEI